MTLYVLRYRLDENRDVIEWFEFMTAANLRLIELQPTIRCHLSVESGEVSARNEAIILGHARRQIEQGS